MSFFCMPFMACNRQIDSFDRRQCNLHVIPNEIDRYSRSLEELLLDCNHIKELPKFLFRCQKLRRLSLNDNEIYRLVPEIAQLTSLVELNLGKNDISDVPEELKHCKLLQILDLSANPITRLPATITQLSTLTRLRLNDISLTVLPSDIGALTEMRELEVRENLLRSLPSLQHLTKLQILDLGDNELDQLPKDIENMVSLRELYVDKNDLELLPDEITRCRSLDVLDVSENRLTSLPDDIGLLENLTELIVANNCLTDLPNSLGRLKKLNVLKAEKNAINRLTQAIGSCTAMEELQLTANNLSELPSSIGNLVRMKSLNVDKNCLTSIPSTIGGCASLTMLSLRENQISELPMDIGKCERLTVLDLCSNRLRFLPFTINVLFKLQALWLSENQSQAMLKLQQERDPSTGVKVLTCYLLPQLPGQQNETERSPGNRAFVGGPKVHFGDMNNTADEEKTLPTGNFERHGTPHPKPHAAKLKKNTIDGHIIHHDENQGHPTNITLQPKRSVDNTSTTSPTSNGVPSTSATSLQPRSALRFQAVPVQQYVPETHITPADHDSGTASGSAHSSQQQLNNYERSVAFATGTTATSSEEEHRQARLKRVNTPHYGKQKAGVRPVHAASSPSTTLPPSTHSEMNRSSSSLRGLPESQIVQIIVYRDDGGSLGLSIAGGAESTPYKEGDQGLFVSRVTPGGPADRAGLRQGDKLLRVNETDVVNVRHDVAVGKMKDSLSKLELTILRTEEASVSSVRQSPNQSQSLDASFMSDANEVSSMSRETMSTTIKRDTTGSPGFTIAGGTGAGREGFFISQITPGGAAAKDGKLQVGDRVLSINGTSLRGARHDQAVALLTGHADNEVYLVVQRERPSLTSPLPPSINTPTQSPPNPAAGLVRAPSRSAPLNLLGDTTSWDGTQDEVELVKDDKSLGLSVVGGSDHSSHPFGITNPGVFISKIAANSPASRCGRLRIGDRILEVNGRDVRAAKHIDAVEALKNSQSKVRLRVQHDPQPAGLKEVTILRREGGTLGISIHGGVKSTPANPIDPSDEGIFIDRVEAGGVSEAAGLIAGQRIIEVNGESLLGCTQEEAASALRRALELKMLVCDGYNRPSTTTTKRAQTKAHTPNNDENSMEAIVAVDPIRSPSPIQPLNHNVQSSSSTSTSHIPLPSSHLYQSPNTSVLSEAPLATSSPLPTATVYTKPSKIPPPVAPKPTLKMSQLDNIRSTKSGNESSPERLNFSSKIQKFEREIEIKRPDRNTNGSSLPPPEKKPLLSETDMKKLKEEEAKKLQQGIPEPAPIESPEKDVFFDQLIDNSYMSPNQSGSNGKSMIPIRSKKAETRAIAAGQLEPEEGLSESERAIREQQKRSEWRAARLKSLDQERAAADALMSRLQMGSPMDSINESTTQSSNDHFLTNESLVEKSESYDPETGTNTLTITQKRYTKREFEVGAGEIGFADD